MTCGTSSAARSVPEYRLKTSMNAAWYRAVPALEQQNEIGGVELGRCLRELARPADVHPRAGRARRNGAANRDAACALRAQMRA